MREYYALYTCDAWKTHSSMTLVGVFTKAKLISIIKKYVKESDPRFEFESDLKKIESMEINEIDNSLKYGYIQKIKINEIL